MTVQIDTVQCAQCGVYFGIEHNYRMKLEANAPHQDFYCTNGCVLHFIPQPKMEQKAPVEKKDNILSLIKKETNDAKGK